MGAFFPDEFIAAFAPDEIIAAFAPYEFIAVIVDIYRIICTKH